MELNMVYVVSERPAVGLSGPMADPEVLSSEDTAKSRLALYGEISPGSRAALGSRLVSVRSENWVRTTSSYFTTQVIVRSSWGFYFPFRLGL